LLAAVAILSGLAASAVSTGAAIGRRAAEEELLAIGEDFERALRSYAGRSAVSATASLAPAGSGPRDLEELLRDPRATTVRRHLRRIPVDPLSGQAQWGIVRDPHGVIVGLHSLAPGRPLRRTGFTAAQAHFEEADSYAQWIFRGGVPPSAPLTPSPSHAPP